MRLIPAQFVKPYIKSNKSDIIDAEAIAEAATRPTMRFAVKRSEDLTPHCLKQNVTHRVDAPDGALLICCPGSGGGWHGGSAWRHGRSWFEAIIERYRSSCRADKQGILDEFVAVTGYHRKHAIRVLSRRKQPSRGHKNTSLRYGSDVRDALILLWEVSERLCSKRLKPLIPVLLPALECHGRLQLNAELRGKLMTVSPATMDRLLTEVRIVARGGQRRRAGMGSAVRRSVPVRTFGDWNDPPPGFVEVDFVAHSGTSSSGSFVQTMVLTDISTGWTECVPVRTRDSGNVIVAIKQARWRFPFPLLGVDFDNDSAFMNEVVVSWCRSENLEVTRSRAYRKNDQAHVEQKNGASSGGVRSVRRYGSDDCPSSTLCGCPPLRQSVPAVI
nr:MULTISPECIES: transposase family protein [Rhizobium]